MHMITKHCRITKTLINYNIDTKTQPAKLSPFIPNEIDEQTSCIGFKYKNKYSRSICMLYDKHSFKIWKIGGLAEGSYVLKFVERTS